MAREGLFPGGGRILFGDGWGLKWLSADGRVDWMAKGFLGADLVDQGTRVLARKLTREDYDFYLMDLDGSDRLHLAARRRDSAVSNVVVSPDGTRAVYVRTRLGIGPWPGRLFLVDLRTGDRVNLGLIGPITSDHELAWNSDSLLILVQAPDGGSIHWVRAPDGRRGTWLSVGDSRIVSAYRRARPEGGLPQEILPLGWSPDPHVLSFAALVSGPEGRRPAVLILDQRRRTFGYAPDHRHPFIVDFQWAPIGRTFTLLSIPPYRREPKGTIYLGHAGRRHLHRIIEARGLHAGPILSPDASTLLSQVGTGPWGFVRTGVIARACVHPATCPRPNPVVRLEAQGNPVAWA
jgi:hypothetical protein